MAHILLIDDDPGIRDSLTLMLRTAGHTIESAANGRAGLELAARTQFELVITDVLMPEMDGAEAVRGLRALPQPPKILVMTGGAVLGADLMALAGDYGVDASITKPFRPKELFAVIDRVLKRAQ
jgi:two-component system chemotaxis response regulator CheY